MTGGTLRLGGMLLLAGVLACGDGGEPGASLVGSWDVIGFSDAGVAAATSGTFTFNADGSFSADVQVTFPGEPTDQVHLQGSWQQTGSQVTLSSGAESSTWTATFARDQITLTEAEPPPANEIILRRR